MTSDVARWIVDGISGDAAPPAGHPSGSRGLEPAGRTLSPEMLERVRKFQDQSLSANTRLGYESDWRQFVEWCEFERQRPLPADPLVVAAYLSAAAELLNDRGQYLYAPATLSRWLAAINKAHENADHVKPGVSPEVTKTIRGIRRSRKTPVKRARPLLLDDIRRILETADIRSFPGGVSATRNTTILLLGFAGAFRRSEIANLQVRDMSIHPQDGLHVTLRTSKTDQDADGFITALPYGSNPVTCPVCAYIRWLRISTLMRAPSRGILMKALREQRLDEHICHLSFPDLDLIDPQRPLFQPLARNGRTSRQTPITGTTVMDAVEYGVRLLGLDPAPYGGHSLRAGFVTQALRSGASLYEVMKQTHHTKVDTVGIYDRQDNPLVNNAVLKVGL